ncbi:MAG: RidA family protein [Candidatus Bathyarchaeia archaeon]
MSEVFVVSKEIVSRTGIFADVKVGSLLFLSGLLGDTSADVPTQITQILEKVKAKLEAAGSSMRNVVKATVYLRDIADRERYLNAIWQKYFSESPPARTTVQVGLGAAAVEIDVIAVVP